MGWLTGRRRRALAGLTDQAFTAGANAVNGLVAGVLLGPAGYGRYVAAIGVAFIAIAVGRAFVGEVLLTHGARTARAAYQRLVSNASATALGLGAMAAALAAGIWLVGVDLMSDLLWLVPFLPAAMLADAGRYAFLARRRPQRSMTITGVALLVQLTAVTGLVATGMVRPATLLLAWGCGVLAGAGMALPLLGVNPVRGRPQGWVSETRHLSGWFTGTAILAQTQNWAVLYFVGGFLGHAELGGLRMLQMLVLMPVQNFIWALAGLLVPGYSHFVATGDLARLRRRTRALGSGLATVAVLLVALVPVGRWLLATGLPEYAGFGVLMLPVALQAGLYMVQAPWNASLRGMQRGRYTFGQYASFTAVILPASLLGAGWFGVVGTAYGMALGALAGGVAAYVCYRRALRDLATPDREPAPVEVAVRPVGA